MNLDALYSDMQTRALGVFRLRLDGFHGPSHWQKVWHNCQDLAQPNTDLKVCAHFAALHDMMRLDEGYDPLHGPRAAEYVTNMSLDLDADQIALLTEAIATHSDGLLSDDPTVAVCHDADRLDLPRVGITPNPEYMSTELGRRLCPVGADEIAVINYWLERTGTRLGTFLEWQGVDSIETIPSARFTHIIDALVRKEARMASR